MDTLQIIGVAENKEDEQAQGKHTPTNFEKYEILECFIKFPGKKNPIIEIITSASTQRDESFNVYKKAVAEL